MNRVISLAASMLTCPPLPLQATSALDGIHRIAFLGDSITEAAEYTTDIECWLISQGQRVEVLNIGLSSETATELTSEENAGHVKGAGFPRPFIGDRLDRALAITRPDLLFVCYGMNDGSALPVGGDGLSRFSEAITRLRDTALQLGVRQVVFSTPPLHDPVQTIDPANNPHERNLVAYREWLLSKRAEGWEVVDIHGPMRRDLDAARKIDPAFRFQPDGVHPNRNGHWLMAREILTQFFDANLDGISSSAQFFKANGDRIRDIVHQRQKVQFSSLMTRIGHARPQVPGGPGTPPGPTAEAAQSQVKEITQTIHALTH